MNTSERNGVGKIINDDMERMLNGKEYYLKLTNDMFPDILEKVNLYINDAIPRIGGNNEE